MRLQLWRTYGVEVVEKFFRFSKIALPLAIVAVCLFGYVLRSHSGIFREFQAALLSVEWMLLACLVVWCGTFIFLTFIWADWPLIGLLLIGIAAYFIGYAASSREADTIIFLAGVTLGRGARVFVGDEVTSLISKRGNKLETPYVVSYFLIGLVVLLTFSAWWRLNLAGTYHGPRWMGLWNNPNIYGMLMSAGVVLSTGLFLADRKLKIEDGENNSESGKRKVKTFFLWIAAGMMTLGLFFSYSRGAWLATIVGLLYLVRVHGKFNWRFVLPAFLVVATVVLFLWNSTPDTSPWYMKRMDLSRPSAQHRVAAWKAGFEIMRDHPFGVGWNKAVSVYEKSYSPPENGAAALTMNSYLMLGTELGLPALLCFIAYIYLKFKQKTADSLQVACRAGALVLLVAFWFDGGLFTLATAAVFWILLELGTSPPQQTGIPGKRIEQDDLIVR
jgi:hypothetical protein